MLAEVGVGTGVLGWSAQAVTSGEAGLDRRGVVLVVLTLRVVGGMEVQDRSVGGGHGGRYDADAGLGSCSARSYSVRTVWSNMVQRHEAALMGVVLCHGQGHVCIGLRRTGAEGDVTAGSPRRAHGPASARWPTLRIEPPLRRCERLAISPSTMAQQNAYGTKLKSELEAYLLIPP